MSNEIIQNVAYDNYDDFQHVNFNYEKEGVLQLALQLNFLSCKGHLQLIVFIRHEC
jgi:hypothetical protein